MIIKVDKILLDSQPTAGMIGGVRITDPHLAWNLKGTPATATSKTQDRFASPS